MADRPAAQGQARLQLVIYTLNILSAKSLLPYDRMRGGYGRSVVAASGHALCDCLYNLYNLYNDGAGAVRHRESKRPLFFKVAHIKNFVSQSASRLTQFSDAFRGVSMR